MQYQVEKNLKQIQEKIVPYKPNIIAVTKYFGCDAIVEAFNAGIRDFAESRVIEAAEKIENLPKDIRENSTFHFIGHLQSNKAKKAVQTFDIIHSVDSIKLAEKVSNYALEAGKIQKILLQLNIAREAQKSGFEKEQLLESFPQIANLKGLKILGLMCMTPLGETPEKIRSYFQMVRETRDLISGEYGCSLPELSMGMSQDYDIAAQEGATMLRIGRRLFSFS